jgi:small subunit ribosomal protein S20
LIDRAAKWGIIKKNTAARYKSRLTIRLRKIASA